MVSCFVQFAVSTHHPSGIFVVGFGAEYFED